MNFEVDRDSCGYLKVIGPRRSSSNNKRIGTVTFLAVVAFLTCATGAWGAEVSASVLVFSSTSSLEPTAGARAEFSSQERSVPRQYHLRPDAISTRIGSSITDQKCCLIAQRNSSQNAGIAEPNRDREAKDAQYHDRLMLQIGAVLGLAYAAFLAIWFWATRLRAH
jgi:hypothetical protein